MQLDQKTVFSYTISGNVGCIPIVMTDFGGFKVDHGCNEIYIKKRRGDGKHINENAMRHIIQIRFVDLIPLKEANDIN